MQLRIYINRLLTSTRRTDAHCTSIPIQEAKNEHKVDCLRNNATPRHDFGHAALTAEAGFAG